MKILQIINNLSGGGAEKLLVDLSINLVNKGHDVFVVVLGKPFGIYEDVLKAKGVRVVMLRMKKYDFRAVGRISKFIDENKINVVHSHLFPSQYFAALTKSENTANVKFITTEHSSSNARRELQVFKLIDSFFYRRYDYIVGITPKVISNLEEHLNDNIKQKIRLIPNGVDLSVIRNTVPLSSLSSAKYNIVQVGRFESMKRQDLAIKAMKILVDKGHDIHLSFVGMGSLVNESKKMVSELNLNQRVSFLGFRKDVYSIIKAADLIIMPSDWEGLSLAAIEGVASGTPLIATNVPGLREVVEGAGLLVEKGNYVDLSSKILQVIADKGLQEDMALRGKEKSKEYDIDIMVDKYLQLYQNRENE